MKIKYYKNFYLNLPPPLMIGIFNNKHFIKKIIKMNRSILKYKKQIYIFYKNLYNYSNNTKNELIILEETCNIHSFKEPNNLKEIYNAWDIFIDWSLNNGNSHIAFTINLSKDYEIDIVESYTNILKMHPIIQNTENYKKYHNLRNLLFHDHTGFSMLFNDINDYVRLVTWNFITTEENKKGVLHFHGIIAYKNLMDYNKNIKNNILNHLKSISLNEDIVLKDLNKFKDIKGWIQYLHKGKTLIFPPYFNSIEKHIDFIKDIFQKPYINNYNLKNTKKDIYKRRVEGYGSWYYSICIYLFDVYNTYNDCFLDYRGICLNKNELNENIFIDLILNYLYFKEYYIYNEYVYIKIKNTIISYKKIGTIKDILFDQFETNIIMYFIQTFPCQFTGFDFYFLIKTYKIKMESNILKIKILTTNKIQLNFSYLEFTDGIYDIANNKFIKTKFFNKTNISTTKYYNKSYSWIRQNKPNEWIEGIKNALGKDNIQDFTIICLFIASFFQEKNDNIKKNFLYVHGKTNTGKSTYLTKVLTRYYGLENIGNIVNSSNFKFQDLKNKLLVIMDEFRYSSSTSSDLLKLLGSEPLLTTQKYSKDHIIIDKLMGIILSNYLFLEKNESVNKALLERLYIIEFLNSISSYKNNINQLLSEEEANIIIFCNKMYFSYFNKKSTREKQIENEFNLNINKQKQKLIFEKIFSNK